MKKPLVFHQLSRSMLDTLPKDRSLFIFPVGILEDHGPHLPMGVDTLTANAVLNFLGEQWMNRHSDWQVILMPDFFAGVQSEAGGFNLSIRPYVLRDWLIDVCLHLSKLDFSNFACWSGTVSPKQLTSIEEASKAIQKRGWVQLWKNHFPNRPLRRSVFLSLNSALIPAPLVKRFPFYSSLPEHGGAFETGLAQALGIPLTGEFQTLPRKEPIKKWGTGWLFPTTASDGYWGAPAEADAQKSKILIEAQIQSLVEKMEEVLVKKRNPQFVFRSWYSILPPNQSFFKAWFLFFLFFVIFTAWIVLVVDFTFPTI